jgi:hypothetical protein
MLLLLVCLSDMYLLLLLLCNWSAIGFNYKVYCFFISIFFFTIRPPRIDDWLSEYLIRQGNFNEHRATCAIDYFKSTRKEQPTVPFFRKLTNVKKKVGDYYYIYNLQLTETIISLDKTYLLFTRNSHHLLLFVGSFFIYYHRL